jgi:hypothetical protein
VAAIASRPTGLHSRRYAKLPTLVRACQPPALPSRFASYVQVAAALVRVLAPGQLVSCFASVFSRRLRRVLRVCPAHPRALPASRHRRAGCPSAPKGLPAVPRQDTPPDGGGLLGVLSGLSLFIYLLLIQ